MVTCTGHIGIHEGADGRTYVRCTDVHDVMAIKPNFLTSMGYHIFLSMVLRARAPSARAELRYYLSAKLWVSRATYLIPSSCANLTKSTFGCYLVCICNNRGCSPSIRLTFPRHSRRSRRSDRVRGLCGSG